LSFPLPLPARWFNSYPMSFKTSIKSEMLDQSAGTPLDLLARHLQTDMDKVNALILDRLHGDIPLIGQVASHLIAAGGKRIRPLLTLAATALYGPVPAKAYGLAASVEFIHTATLLHDDVVDESAQRRGKDSANIVFGNQAPVLVGDFLFSRAFQLMVEEGSMEVLRILSDASAIIAQGEVMQLQNINNVEISMEDYNTIIGSKTAALFAAACEIGPVIAGADKQAQAALRAYGYNLGMAFQIADDVLDYNANREKLGKTIGDDFREGKMTAPLLLAYAKADTTEKAFWTRTIAEKDQKEGDLQTAIGILQKYKALEEGLALSDAYAALAHKALSHAPEGPLKPILDDLIAFTINRSH